jgi:hypothetical protein
MSLIAGASPSEAAWSGVFAILCTPFRPDSQFTPASLRREIAFCLESGVHGIVALTASPGLFPPPGKFWSSQANYTVTRTASDLIWSHTAFGAARFSHANSLRW